MRRRSSKARSRSAGFPGRNPRSQRFSGRECFRTPSWAAEDYRRRRSGRGRSAGLESGFDGESEMMRLPALSRSLIISDAPDLTILLVEAPRVISVRAAAVAGTWHSRLFQPVQARGWNAEAAASPRSSLIERKIDPLNDCEFRRREAPKTGCPAVKRE